MTIVRVGTREELLRANRIKVVGVCATDSAQLRIGPVQEGKPLRGAVVYADSHTLGYHQFRGTSTEIIGSAPSDEGDRGDFNAYTGDPSGSLDGSFFANYFASADGANDRCVFQASAIAG